MQLSIAAKRVYTTRVETLPIESDVDRIAWLHQRVDALADEGANGPLYIFLDEPLSPAMADALLTVSTGRRFEPAIVAGRAACRSRNDLESIRRARARGLYLTLHSGTADAHDARAGAEGDLRRVLLLLDSAASMADLIHVGVHHRLSMDSAAHTSGILRLAAKTHSELLLWDASCGWASEPTLEPAAALRMLDSVVTATQRLRVHVRAVGFERTQAVVSPSAAGVCVPCDAVIDLLRDGIPLPSAAGGLLTGAGDERWNGDHANHDRVDGLAHELAGRGFPFLDLPACAGGAPPQRTAQPPGTKTEACGDCPIDPQCLGLASSVADRPGVRDEVRPLPHWSPLPLPNRALVLCPPETDPMLAGTFIALARELADLGVDVDVVTPDGIHRNAPESLPRQEPVWRLGELGEVGRFVTEGPVEDYGLIVAPDPRIARPLVTGGRLDDATRLAVTDFHMLAGIDEWVRDLCPPGRRAEEGGWWPSERIVLYSGFPGYARLYRRYGIPLRQVAWQPFSLDPTRFVAECAVEEGEEIVSAGRHRRDLETLLAAASRLGRDVHPIGLYAKGQAPRVPRQVEFRGYVRSEQIYPRIGRSRFVIVPLKDDPILASGITAIVTSMLLGRPVVATASTAAIDYVEHGVNGLLVPPDDPVAMARAIERLDTDPSLLATLAEGARKTARSFTIESWARSLVRGSNTHGADHWMWAKWRARTATSTT